MRCPAFDIRVFDMFRIGAYNTLKRLYPRSNAFVAWLASKLRVSMLV
jgi:hypothetical protein